MTPPLPSQAPAPRPFPALDSPFPFPFALPPPLSIAPFDWPSTPEPGRPIGEPGWRHGRGRKAGPSDRGCLPLSAGSTFRRRCRRRPRRRLRQSCRGTRAQRRRGQPESEGRTRGRERTGGRAGGRRRRPASWERRCGAVVGADPAGPGRGGRVAGPAMADNEKLDNQRLKNFKNKGRDLEVRWGPRPPGPGGTRGA